MRLSKLEVVRRQLGTALALFLNDHDSVSVHSLASGACEIIEHLAETAGKTPFRDHALESIPDLTLKKLREHQREFWNAFKHGLQQDRTTPRDDTDILERFSDEINDHVMFIGWYDYMLATGTLPVEAQAFQAWYFAKYPEKLAPDVSSEPYMAIFPNLDDAARLEQKRRLRARIEASRARVADDPRTDTRPLILPAVL